MEVAKKYITINQASKLLGVSALTLRNWDRAGKLKAYRNPMNNYRLYRRDQIELLLRKFEGSISQSIQRKIDI